VEILGNDRVIGGLNEASTAAAADLYASFVEGELVRTDAVTAELCKLMENTYRDVNIALANELSRVAEEFGIDINRAIEVANRHPRVNLLKPGIGVGGHCIPIDPWFIAEVAPESCRLIPTARQLNDIQPERIASLIRRCLRDVRDPRILLAGATYKPEVYDLRQSPALEIARLLDRDGYQVELWDPITAEYGDKPLVDAARGCDTLAVLVPHKIVLDEIAEQREVLRGTMRCDRVIDLSTSFVRTL
jgi:UDP-N-acetyl-D-mannosaminuronic acid dehydrogenase